MSSALEFDGRSYRNSPEMLEHFLRRGAVLAAARLGPVHPATRWLASHRDAAIEGAAIVLDGALPLAEDRAALAGIIEAVGSEGLNADSFDRAGAKWVRGELAELVAALRGQASTVEKGEPVAPSTPWDKSPKFVGGYGAASIVIAAFLFLSGVDGQVAGLIFSLGVGALIRAFWLSWGLDPEDARH